MHRHDLGAEQLHAEDVGLLPLDIGVAHINDALQIEERAGRRGRDAVLAGAGLGDDAALAHAPCQEDLAEHVVDLVRAGVVELVALEVDFGAAEMAGQPLGEVKRARSPNIVVEVIGQLGVEIRVAFRLVVGALDGQDQRHQGFGDIAPAIKAEMAPRIRARSKGVAAIGVRCLHLFLASRQDTQRLRATARNSRIFAGSFSPGRRSTPDETSTALAPEIRTASARSAALSPPDSIQGSLHLRPAIRCQSKARPLPPGSASSRRGGLASNSSMSATSSWRDAAATSSGPATATTFITGTPKRALASAT